MGPYTLTVSLNPQRGEDERRQIARVLEELTRDNEAWLRRQKDIGELAPCCTTCAGLKYDPPGRAKYRQGRVDLMCAADLLDRGAGDCGSIAALEAACLRVRGIQAVTRVTAGPYGAGSYHADVRLPSGRIIDTTKTLEAA